MGNVSKNFNKGGQITDINVIVMLAKNRKSLVVNGTVKPAAIILNWILRDIIKAKIFYAIHDSEIAEVDFEELKFNS